MTLCSEDWSSEVSSVALPILQSRKFNNPKRLPDADDLQKLNIYLQGVAAEELRNYKNVKIKELGGISNFSPDGGV